MKINESTIKMWSRIGSRAAYGMAALELGHNYSDLILITADTSTSAGLDRFKKTFPNKFLDVFNYVISVSSLSISASVS